MRVESDRWFECILGKYKNSVGRKIKLHSKLTPRKKNTEKNEIKYWKRTSSTHDVDWF